MPFLSRLFLLAMGLALTGCRIEVFVPEGGHVQTASGSFTCGSGETCYIDVGDTLFDETFNAVADKGYFFQGWDVGHRYLCGGKSKPCHLYTSGFGGNALLESFLDSDEIFYLQPAFRSEEAADTHTVGPAGGRFEFLNGVILEVPAGAVAEDIDITLGELSPNKVQATLNRQTHAFTRKRHLGGFSAVPAVEFAHPVTALVPVLPPRSRELTMQMEIEADRQQYWIEPTDLDYLPESRRVRLQISHFSDHAVGAIDGIDPQRLENLCTDPAFNFLQICKDFDELQPSECLLAASQRPPGTVCCRELSFTARSEASDFSSNRESGDCQIISDRVNVTYHDCALPDGSPAPVESHGLCEMSPNCPRDRKLGFDVEIDTAPPGCFSVGEKVRLHAAVRDADGVDVAAPALSWRSLDQGVATVGPDGEVSAVGAGRTTVEATYSHECKDYSATVALRVLDLEGRWSGREVADERGCDEGINTYRRTVTVNQTGDRVRFSWSGASVAGTKQGCRISGLGSEREDGGVTVGSGSLTVARDGRRMTGSSRWTWTGTEPGTGEKLSCSGTSELEMTR